MECVLVSFPMVISEEETMAVHQVGLQESPLGHRSLVLNFCLETRVFHYGPETEKEKKKHFKVL